MILVFKQRAKLSDNQYLSLLKFFNITIPKVNGMLDHNAFKQRDFMHQANEKLLQKLYKVVNSENGGIEPVIGKSNLNYFIGRGNNFYLIRQVIKRRVWWTRASREDFLASDDTDEQVHYGCNFIWTQWKKRQHLEALREPGGDLKIYNRMDNNFHLSNKKALFRNVV